MIKPKYGKPLSLIIFFKSILVVVFLVFSVSVVFGSDIEIIQALKNKNFDLALKILQKEKNIDEAQAANNIGSYFYKDRSDASHLELAVEWFEKSAQLGNNLAQFNLGVLYTNGKGKPFDLNKAMDYFLLAAKGGNLEAKYNLGILLLEESDKARSNEGWIWLEKARKLGHPYAGSVLSQSSVKVKSRNNNWEVIYPTEEYLFIPTKNPFWKIDSEFIRDEVHEKRFILNNFPKGFLYEVADELIITKEISQDYPVKVIFENLNTWYQQACENAESKIIEENEWSIIFENKVSKCSELGAFHSIEMIYKGNKFLHKAVFKKNNDTLDMFGVNAHIYALSKSHLRFQGNRILPKLIDQNTLFGKLEYYLSQDMMTINSEINFVNIFAEYVKDTRFQGKVRINSSPKFETLNFYVLKDDPEGYFPGLSCNCGQLLDQKIKKGNIIVCDSKLIKTVFDFANFSTHEPEYDSEDSKDKYKNIIENFMNNLDDFTSTFFLKWLIGHEIGHAVNRHGSIHNFYFLHPKNRISPQVKEGFEVEADQYFLENVPIQNLHMGRHALNQIMIALHKNAVKIVAKMKSAKDSRYSPEVEIVFKQSKRNIHDPLIKRALRLINQFPKIQPEVFFEDKFFVQLNGKIRPSNTGASISMNLCDFKIKEPHFFWRNKK
jgi:TPR repeat protein